MNILELARYAFGPIEDLGYAIMVYNCRSLCNKKDRRQLFLKFCIEQLKNRYKLLLQQDGGEAVTEVQFGPFSVTAVHWLKGIDVGCEEFYHGGEEESELSPYLQQIIPARGIEDYSYYGYEYDENGLRSIDFSMAFTLRDVLSELLQ